MPGYSAGDAFVRILPDFTGILARISAEAQRWGTQAGRDFSDAFNRASRATGNGPIGPSGSQSARQGTQSGGAFATAFRRRVEASLRSMPDISVGAATGPAEQRIRDLQARLTALRNVNIGVDMDAQAALVELRALQSELAAVSASATDIQVRADTTAAAAQLAAFEADLRRLSGQDATVDVRLSGGFAQRVKAQITAALDDLPEAVIGANSTQVETKLAEIRAELSTLRDLEVGVDIDAGAAMARIAAVQAALVELRASNPTIDVDVDAARAQAALAAIAAEVAALNGKNVDVDTSGGIKGFQALLAAGIILAPALIPIGAAIAAAFAGIAVATAGAVAAIGVIALAVMPVVKALMAMSAANKAAAEDARKSSKQQADAAYAVQQANQQVASAEESLANTRANAASQAVAGARRIADAQQGVIRAERDAAEAAEGSAERVADAQRGLRDARVAAAEAARSAARAVADAERDLLEVQQANAASATDLARRSRDAAVDLADAERDAADDIAAAQRDVEDSRESAAAVAAESARKVESALRRQRDAEQDLADAQESATEAQEALTRARRDAEDRLEDLQSRAANGALSERDALFELEDQTESLRLARESLANGTNGIDEADIARTQLKYDEAVQSLADIRLENARIAEEQERANAAGVEGSDLVVRAQEDIADAQLRVQSATEANSDAQIDLADAQVEATARNAEAQAALEQALARQPLVLADIEERMFRVRREFADLQAEVVAAPIEAAQKVADAEERLREAQREGYRTAWQSEQQIAQARRGAAAAAEAHAAAQREGAERVAAAERSVSDAIATQATQRRQAAFAVAQAEQGVVNAQRAAGRAVEQNAESSSKAQRDLAAAMGGLTPAGQSFVTFLYDKMRPALGGLSDAAQTGLLPGLQKGLESVLPLLPALKGFVGKISATLGDLFAQAGEGLTGPAFTGLFSTLGDVLPDVLRTMGSVIGSLAKGLAGLFEAVIPLGLEFGESLSGTLERFANWATTLNSNEGFKGFLEYAKESLPLVGGFFANLFQVIGKVIEVAAPFGAVVLGALSTIFDLISKIPTAVLAGIFLALGVAIAALASGAIATAVAFTLIGIGVTYLIRYADDLWRFLQDKLGPTFTWLWEKISAGIGLLQPVWTFVEWLFGQIVEKAQWLYDVLVGHSIIPDLVNEIARLFEWLVTPVKVAWDAISAAIDFWWKYYAQPLMRAFSALLTDVVGPAVTWLYEKAVKPAFDGIAAAVSLAWSAGGTGLKVVLGLVKDAVDAVGSAFGSAKDGIETAWNAVKTLVSNVWAAEATGLKVVLGFVVDKVGAVKSGFDTAKTGIETAWGAVKGVVADVWNAGEGSVKSTFDAIESGVGKVSGWFTTAVSGIKTAWDGLKAVAAAPIHFVLDTVINKGLIKAFNWIADKLPGIDPIDPVAIPAALRPKGRDNPNGYATGGVLPGYTPGRDVHRFYSPTAGALDLSGGEAILRPEVTRALGADWVNAVNRAAREGGLGGVLGHLGGFAGGGILGSIGGAARGGIDWAKEGIKGAVGSAKDFVVGNLRRAAEAVLNPLFDQLRGLNAGMFGDLGVGVATHLRDKILSFAGGKDAAAAQSSGGFASNPSGWPPRMFWQVSPNTAAAAQAIQAQFGVNSGILGTRANASDHPWGKALDAMIPGWDSAQGVAQGNAIASFLARNADEFGLKYLIWRQRIDSGSGWRSMEDRGSPTANHYDHVHASFYDSGGYLPPGLTLAYNGTGRPEPVFTEAQFSALASLGGSSSSSVERNYNYYAAEGRSMPEDDFLEAGARAEVLMAGW